jgi:hypothetical protein
MIAQLLAWLRRLVAGDVDLDVGRLLDRASQAILFWFVGGPDVAWSADL